jgi:hypothetical protein
MPVLLDIGLSVLARTDDVGITRAIIPRKTTRTLIIPEAVEIVQQPLDNRG